MGNRAAEEIVDDRSSFAPKIVGARRKTENFTVCDRNNSF